MNRFTLSFEIDLDNDAFQDGNLEAEVTRIMKQALDKIPVAINNQGHTQSLIDINGNRVGSFKYHWKE